MLKFLFVHKHFKMKKSNRKKLLLKKRTVSFLTDSQMDKVLGATGDECFSATCPGDRGCGDLTEHCDLTDVDCPADTSQAAGCPADTSQAAGCNVTTPLDGCFPYTNQGWGCANTNQAAGCDTIMN